MILSRNTSKRVGESRHPCRTSTVVRNQSPMLLLKRVALVALSQRFLMTRIRLIGADVLRYGWPQSSMSNPVEGNCRFLLQIVSTETSQQVVRVDTVQSTITFHCVVKHATMVTRSQRHPLLPPLPLQLPRLPLFLQQLTRLPPLLQLP